MTINLNKQSTENKLNLLIQQTSNIEIFIKAINSENNITKYLTIKNLNSSFSDIENIVSLGRFVSLRPSLKCNYNWSKVVDGDSATQRPYKLYFRIDSSMLLSKWFY